MKKFRGVFYFLILVLILSSTSPTGAQSSEGWNVQQQTDVEKVAFSHPTLMNFFTSDDPFDIVIGHQSGRIIVQDNIGKDTLIYEPEEGGIFKEDLRRSAPTAFDGDSDGDLDLLVGLENGSLIYYERDQSSFKLNNEFVRTINQNLEERQITYSKPAIADLNADGFSDIIIGHADGGLSAFINTNTRTNPVWKYNAKTFENIFVSGHASPSAIDPDKNGIFDIIVGTEKSGIVFLKNTADTGEISKFEVIDFTHRENPFRDIDLAGKEFLTPFFVDLNSDGFLDFIMGEKSGVISIYYNSNVDLIDVQPSILTEGLIFSALITLIATIILTYIIVKRQDKIKGEPIYLMLIHSIGISPFKFKFTEEIISDTNLAGGAFTGIQAIITEVTGAKELKALDAGENKIQISRVKFKNNDDTLDILLWCTADDPKLREACIAFGTYVVDNFEKSFEQSSFYDEFSMTLNRMILTYFKQWL